ncbi:hypothetical protein GGR50DRAFT_645736 [Xylaria sp. CBS 124048]|nr:hypothetical protein GGR50DRAFT_645736 [Xylaria sp. CBS 124048]
MLDIQVCRVGLSAGWHVGVLLILILLLLPSSVFYSRWTPYSGIVWVWYSELSMFVILSFLQPTTHVTSITN